MNLRDIKVSPMVLTLLLGALAIAMMVYLLFNQLGALHEAQYRLEEEKEALNQVNLQLEQLLELRQRAPEFQEFLNTLERLIPSEPQKEDVLVTLEENARKAGANLARIRFDGYQWVDDYGEIPLQLSYEGDYASFLKMLGQMQHQQGESRAYRIENINLTRERLDMDLKTFFQNNK